MTASDIIGFVPDMVGRAVRYFTERPAVSVEQVYTGTFWEDYAGEEAEAVTDIYFSVQVANDGAETTIRKATLRIRNARREEFDDTKYLDGIPVPHRTAKILKFRFGLNGHIGCVTGCRLSLADVGNRTFGCPIRLNPGPAKYEEGYI